MKCLGLAKFQVLLGYCMLGRVQYTELGTNYPTRELYNGYMSVKHTMMLPAVAIETADEALTVNGQAHGRCG